LIAAAERRRHFANERGRRRLNRMTPAAADVSNDPKVNLWINARPKKGPP
jgi:hypothetical protein